MGATVFLAAEGIFGIVSTLIMTVERDRGGQPDRQETRQLPTSNLRSEIKFRYVNALHIARSWRRQLYPTFKVVLAGYPDASVTVASRSLFHPSFSFSLSSSRRQALLQEREPADHVFVEDAHMCPPRLVPLGDLGAER